jgi:hypothetical protein
MNNQLNCKMRYMQENILQMFWLSNMRDVATVCYLFIYGLFNDDVSKSGYIMSGGCR